MRGAHFPVVHRRARAAFSRRSVAVAAILARELAISLVFRVLALELLEAGKRFGLAFLLLDAFLVKGIVPGKTAVRISVSGLRGICASIEGASTRSRASRIARARADVAGPLARIARADVANVVFGIAREESSERERSPCARRALSNERIFACCVNEWPLSASWFDKSVCNARSSSQDTTQAKRRHVGKRPALCSILPCPRPAEQPRFVSRKNGQRR